MMSQITCKMHREIMLKEYDMLYYQRICLFFICFVLLALPTMGYTWWGEDSTWNIWPRNHKPYQANLHIGPSGYGREYESPVTPPYMQYYPPFVTRYDNPCYDYSDERVNRYQESHFTNRERDDEPYRMPPPRPTEFEPFEQDHSWATPTRNRSSWQQSEPEPTAREYQESVWAYPKPSVAKRPDLDQSVDYTRSVWEYPSGTTPKPQKTSPPSPSNWDYPQDRPNEVRETVPTATQQPIEEQDWQYPPQSQNSTAQPMPDYMLPPMPTSTMEENLWRYPEETIVPNPSESLPKDNKPMPKYQINNQVVPQTQHWQYVDDQGLPPLKKQSNNQFMNGQPTTSPQNTIPRTADFLLPPLKE